MNSYLAAGKWRGQIPFDPAFRFCSACGSRLGLFKEAVILYDRVTGRKMCQLRIQCSKGHSNDSWDQITDKGDALYWWSDDVASLGMSDFDVDEVAK